MLIPDFTPLLTQSKYKNEKAETYLPSEVRLFLFPQTLLRDSIAAF
ncbi:hypothetical protein HMPREF1989_02107 [Porphyromonas gingivalis F0566]|nr:hypothetical protein HMPREF1989_02107 [Porphyromonas gingivalis F0566]